MSFAPSRCPQHPPPCAFVLPQRAPSHSGAQGASRRVRGGPSACALPFGCDAQSSPRAGVAARASPDGGEAPASGVMAFLKNVQSALPVVGLVSRLTAPGGGIEAGGKLSYQEYCRSVYERDTDESRRFGFAVAELSRGQKLSSRIMFVCWAVAQGAGVVPDPTITLACVRLSSKSSDLEYEIFRFEEALDAGLKRRARLQPPPPLPSRTDRRVLAASALRQLLRLGEGEELPTADEREYFEDIIGGW